MLDEINRQRLGIKAAITQINRVIRALDAAKINNTNCEIIKDIDLDLKPGAISIAKAYSAFEEAKSLLEKEAEEYITLVNRQIDRAVQISHLAENVPEKRGQISDWLDRKVIPQLKKSRKSTEDLLLAIRGIPKIEAKQQEQLVQIVEADIEMNPENF